MNLEIKDTKISVGENILSVSELSVLEGEIVILEGENGSGKSTFLMNVTGKINNIKDGSLLLDGDSILGLDLQERSKAGLLYIPQRLPIINGLSMIKILYGVYKNKSNENILEFKNKIEKLLPPELTKNDIISKPLNVLSGGERKRAEMCSVIFSESRLVILDELDSGVDEKTLEIFANQINNLKNSGKSFIIVSHSKEFKKLLNTDTVYEIKNFKINKAS